MELFSRLLSLLFVTYVCYAQTCQPFMGGPVFCEGLINYPVWVPPGVTQEDLSRGLVASGALATSLLPGDCARAMAVSICSQTFRACDDNGLPLPLCSDFCHLGLSRCAGISEAGAIFNCSALDPILQVPPLWQNESCALANATVATLHCPLPFTYRPSTQDCQMRCPPIGLDDETINDNVWLFSKIFGATDILLCVLILIPQWYQTQKGQLNCMFHFWLANLLTSIGFLIGRWNSWREAMCQDPWTLRDSGSTTCFFTALLDVAILFAVAMWLMLAMYSMLCKFSPIHRFFTKLIPNTDRIPWLTQNFAFLMIGWGIAGLIFLIALSNNWINAGNGPLSCGINPSVYNGWVSNGLLMIPLTVVLSVTTIFIFIVMYLLVYMGKLDSIRTQWRFMAVGIYYVIVVWMIVGFTWDSFHGRPHVIKAIIKAISESAVSGGAVNYQTVYNREADLNRGFALAVSLLTLSLPTVIGLIFVSTRSTWDYYVRVFTEGRFDWPSVSNSASAHVSSRVTASSSL